MFNSLTHGGALNNHKNKKEGREIFKNASNCSAKTKNKHTNKKITSSNLISNIQRPTSNSAITLIALIITIIVLLILAGVTLNMIMGENGIIKKAQLAKSKTEEAQQKEENELENLNKQTNDQNSNNPENLEIDDELQKILKEAGMSISTEDILNTSAIMDKIKGLIPEETEDTVKNKTTENGIIEYEDIYGGKIRTNDEYSNRYAWKALNGNTNDMAYTSLKCQSNFYIEYEFPNEVYAVKTKFSIGNGSNYTGKRRIVVQGYNEKNKTWENITDELVYSGNHAAMSEMRDINLKCEKSYKRFRLQFLSIEDSTGYAAEDSCVMIFQLYGTKSEQNNFDEQDLINKMLRENNIKISLKDMMTNKDFTKRLLNKLSIETIKNNNTLRENGYELIPEESESTVKNKTTENGIIEYEDIYGGKIRTNDEYPDNYAWKAFDGKTLTQTYALAVAKPAEFYVEYEFPNEVYALKTKFVITNNSKYNGKRRVVIQGYNEENKIWKNITEELVYSGNYSSLPEERNINLIYDRPYKRFRLQFLRIEDSTGYGAQNSGIITFQLYGKNKK